MEDGPSRRGVDKAHQVAPFIAMLHGGQGTLPVGTPHLVEDRLETNAVYVDCPQLDGTVGNAVATSRRGGRGRAFKAACALGSAWT